MQEFSNSLVAYWITVWHKQSDDVGSNHESFQTLSFLSFFFSFIYCLFILFLNVYSDVIAFVTLCLIG